MRTIEGAVALAFAGAGVRCDYLAARLVGIVPQQEKIIGVRVLLKGLAEACLLPSKRIISVPRAAGCSPHEHELGVTYSMYTLANQHFWLRMSCLFSTSPQRGTSVATTTPSTQPMHPYIMCLARSNTQNGHSIEQQHRQLGECSQRTWPLS
jgi:hypothetical protein